MWDTPEFWARSEADEALREMPDVEPTAMADSLEKSAASYDGEPEMVALIVADLRRRAAAGIRFWPGPQAIVSSRDNPSAAGGRTSDAEIADLIDDEIPW
ncbi:hypothetical protein [Sphingomonas nostoxanthinifaciens]|uniref:hypothetical protein n=1 Tax=Sphingomonas nostoxanthinifaciens TaxID=2872652 RepID=UPI001CC1F088|nr:hypothetical protein [Sphingomonas nostoxanthinifaciens]UAK23826.1 hypothetical protein K8P63_15815 [Sphingomonas nostoxanthinifaciens]